MSQIRYRFKAARDFDIYKFDGPGASVFDVKREIISAKKLGSGTDFDLAIYNLQSEEEYRDDNDIVPKNADIIVKRLPAAPGKGTAKRYADNVSSGDRARPSGMGVLGMGPNTTERIFATGGRNLVLDARKQSQQPAHSTSTEEVESVPADDSEEARIMGMFAESKTQWGQLQEKLATQRYVPNRPKGADWNRNRGDYQAGGANRGNTGDGAQGAGNAPQMPTRAPPENYICHRCLKKGHFINQCPTNGDVNFDKKKFIKPTTGIPRSFLKVVEQPEGATEGRRYMKTATGDLVIAEADSSTWDKYVAKSSSINFGAATIEELLDFYKDIPVPSYLQCPVCERIFHEATVTPCCGTSFCDACVRKELLDNNTECFQCKREIEQGPDGLIPNMNVREYIENYVRGFARQAAQ